MAVVRVPLLCIVCPSILTSLICHREDVELIGYFVWIRSDLASNSKTG